MKQIIVTIFVCVALSALVNPGQRKIAYSRGENIFVADADGTHSKKIAGGAWPEISPDGVRIAFNTEGDAKNRPGPERHIAIADVASGKVTVLPNIPSDNCFRPVWSRDGNQIAYAFDPQFITDDEFLCSIQKENETERSIYRVSMDGKNMKRLIKNGRFPSVSAPQT
jgi:Tol biopolymer transport system component